MLFIDAHVHIYDCFNLELLFNSTLMNFQAAAAQHKISGQPPTFILLLAEGKSSSWFQNQPTLNTSPSAQWSLSTAEKGLSLIARSQQAPHEAIHLIAGRQIVTAERLEVLALFCNTRIDDGLSLDATVRAVHQHDGIPVLPWGVGKWIGKRGLLLRDFLLSSPDNNIFLGDNGGRPWFWPTPKIFRLAGKKGIAVLPGSDPLPFPCEATRIGSFGFYINNHKLDSAFPAASLRSILRAGQEIIQPFGHLQDIASFFRNQLRLRLKT